MKIVNVNISDPGYHGFEQLQDESAIGEVIQQRPQSLEELSEILFKYPYQDNGFATCRTETQAAKELFNEYSLADIIEEFGEYPREVLNDLTINRAHIYFAQKDFNDFLEQEYGDREYPAELSADEKVLATIFDISIDYNMELETEYPEIALAGIHSRTPEEFMEQTEFTLRGCPSEFITDEEIVAVAAIYNSPEELQFAHSMLLKDKSFAKEIVTDNGDLLQYFDPSVQDDLEVVAAAITDTPAAKEFASERFQKMSAEEILDAAAQARQKTPEKKTPEINFGEPKGKGLER